LASALRYRAPGKIGPSRSRIRKLAKARGRSRVDPGGVHATQASAAYPQAGDGRFCQVLYSPRVPPKKATSAAALAGFHAPVRAWFEASFSAPTPAQIKGWPPILAGSSA